VSRRNVTGQADVDRVGREQADDLEGELKKLLPPGHLVKGVQLVAGVELVVRHPLGRVPRGWIVSRRRNGYALPEETGRTARTLTLVSNLASGTFDLWVF
jgi:hypothetical protein